MFLRGRYGIGNSVPAAMKHYAMATDETFRTAAGRNGGDIRGHITGTQAISAVITYRPSMKKPR